MESVIAIKEEKLKKLILEIYDLRDKISEVLNNLEVLVDDSKNYFESDEGQVYREKFRLLSQNFSVFLTNIEGYGQDLEKVIQKFTVLTQKNVDLFNNVM